MPFTLADIQFGAQDAPHDERNIQFSEIAEAGVEVIPQEYLIQYQYISNQGRTPDCTAHAQAGASNENNGIEASKLNALPDARLIDPVQLGEFGHSIGKITANGGFINWAFRYLVNWGYITWYSVVTPKELDIKRAILRNGALVTGSNKITWSEFNPWWIAKRKDASPWHAFRIDGWSDAKQAFRIANSWSEAWWDKGSFWISYNDLDLLFTIYAFHDKDDRSKILRAKAQKLGIWNWKDADRIATRKECVLIASRVAWKVGTEYDLLSIAKLQKVYDGTRDDDNVSLFEAKAIFSRLWVTNSPNWVTRGELVETIN